MTTPQEKPSFNLYIRRLLLVALISLFFVALLSEVGHYFLKSDTDRGPTTIEIVVPEGTADRVAAGEPVPSIPDEMTFVLGDTLVVVNQDVVDHQLGPVWVPPGTSGSLVLDEADNFAFECSFQPTNYLGLDVRPATTFLDRINALLFAAPPTIAFFYLYSLLLFPIGKSKEDPLPIETVDP